MRSNFIVVAVAISFLSMANSTNLFTGKDGKSIMYSVSNETMSWINAVRYCQKNAGILAEILDEHEEKAVHMFLDQVNPEGDKFFWIGLTDLAQEGVWVRLSSGKQTDFTNWVNGRPSNHYEIEHFAQICDVSGERKWNDCDIDNSFGVCQHGSFSLCQHVL